MAKMNVPQRRIWEILPSFVPLLPLPLLLVPLPLLLVPLPLLLVPPLLRLPQGICEPEGLTALLPLRPLRLQLLHAQRFLARGRIPLPLLQVGCLEKLNAIFETP